MQGNLALRFQVIGDQGRYPDPEVHNAARREFASRTAGYRMTGVIGGRFAMRGRGGQRFLEPFPRRPDLDHGIDVNAGGVDVFRVDLARLDEILDLGDRVRPGHGHGRVEVLRRFAVAQIPDAVTVLSAHHGELRAQSSFEDIGLPIEFTLLVRLAEQDNIAVWPHSGGNPGVGIGGSGTRSGVKSGNARPARAQLFAETALRDELDLNSSVEEQVNELLVLANMRRDDAADSPLLEHRPEAPRIHLRVVGDDLEAGHVGIDQ